MSDGRMIRVRFGNNDPWLPIYVMDDPDGAYLIPVGLFAKWSALWDELLDAETEIAKHLVSTDQPVPSGRLLDLLSEDA